MNYIITGGTGFIGTHLTNLIKEQEPDAHVYNLDIVEPAKLDALSEERRVKSEESNSSAVKRINEEIRQYTTIKDWKSPLREGEKRKSTFVYCDVRKPIPDNLPFTPTPDDIIFNFAAVHRTPGHEDIEYFETNIRGAENVCAFAEKWGIRRIVFTSSIAPYGAAEQLKKESTLPTPNTAYGISKLVAEKIHLAWANGTTDNIKSTDDIIRSTDYNDYTDSSDNKETTDCTDSNSASFASSRETKRQLLIVRPGVVFGRGENGNFTRLYWAIRGHKFAYPGRKDTIKACIYVKELVRFMLWEVKQDGQMNSSLFTHPSSLIYNCCFEPAYTIEHIVQAMKNVTGLTQFVPYVPNWIIMPMAVVAKFLGSPMGICPARVKKLQISTNICGEKLKNSGYQFKWTFEEAIKDWLDDNNGEGLK